MDVEPEIILEDGELADDDPIEYTPLERPLNNVVNNTALRNLSKQSDNESDWSSQTENSDSDDFSLSAKKLKVKVKSRKINKPEVKRKKYDIWSSHVQEDVLAETLISCDVSRIDRSRDVESYNSFDLRHKLGVSRQGNKRKHSSRNNKHIRLSRKDESDDEDIKGSVREIVDLVTNVESSEENLAKDIANKLCEEKDDLMLKIVKVAGKKKAIDIFNDVKRIELDGGMLIMNRTRRRTPGGVYLFLVKRDTDLTDEQQKEIFSDEKREQVREKKAKQKAKLKAHKNIIDSKKSELPVLLSRGELTVQKLADLRSERNESEPEEFVNNPPPSPVTDGGKENSNDGLGMGMNDNDDPTPASCVVNPTSRTVYSYADDFLDIGSAVDMDMF